MEGRFLELNKSIRAQFICINVVILKCITKKSSWLSGLTLLNLALLETGVVPSQLYEHQLLKTGITSSINHMPSLCIGHCRGNDC